MNATVPVGACGTDNTGLATTTPIKLNDGKGVARLPDDSFDGASIMETRVVGYADLDGDGTTDALLSVTCAGAPPDMCCASRAGILQFGLPLRRDSRGHLAIVGSAITGGGMPTAGRAIHTIELAGRDVVTTETIIYPEGLTESDLGFPPDATITTTYRLVGGQWTIVSEHP
jgi:hypothetical protein